MPWFFLQLQTCAEITALEFLHSSSSSCRECVYKNPTLDEKSLLISFFTIVLYNFNITSLCRRYLPSLVAKILSTGFKCGREAEITGGESVPG